MSAIVPLLALLALGVWAQSDMAQCGSGFDWNKNSLGQDPCTVGSMLDASCRSLTVYTYPPINATQYYLPPRANHSGDLMCDCNTVMYCLYMACTSCQGGEVYSWLQWIPECSNVSVANYPVDIAQGTAVPHWAYENITALPNMTYNDSIAMAVGQYPEQLPNQISTLTVQSSTDVIIIPGSSTNTPGPTNTNNTSKGGDHVGAIVGGVVGSIVPLTILGVVAFIYTRHHRPQNVQQAGGAQPTYGPYKQSVASPYGPSTTSIPLTRYDPSDPSTFPQDLPSSATYRTPPKDTARATYSGAAEV